MKFFSFILLGLWSLSGYAANTTLTFESLRPTPPFYLPNTIFFNNTISESGYTLTTSDDRFSAMIVTEYSPLPSYDTRIYTHSNALQSNLPVSLISTDGSAFSANSIDLVNSHRAANLGYPYYGLDPSFINSTVTFTGIKTNGASVSQSFTLTSQLLTYNLINFDNIVSLSWTGVNGYQFDNISLAAAVPEPDSYAMLILGIAMVNVASKRFRKSQK